MHPHVLLASAELDPLVKVGGLGEAVAGLARALHRLGVRVDVVVPDYPVPLPASGRSEWQVALPWWAKGGRVRSVSLPGLGQVHAVEVEGIDRPHPYVDPTTGHGWHDNDRRFAFFSAAVAAVARSLDVDVLVLNDWHTALAVAWFPPEQTVLTVHNLAHQGVADLGWMNVIGPRADAFEHLGAFNPLAGAIRLSGRVVTVSRTYAGEVVRPEHGCGLHDELAARGDHLVGIRNGVDVESWNPATDPHLPANYDRHDLSGKEMCRDDLRRQVGVDGPGPMVGMVTRLVDQKGVDFLIDLIQYLEALPASLVLHGTGDPALANTVRKVADQHRRQVRVVDGYDEPLAHRIVAGSDLWFMPSRFEPCGLTQMQAMRFGTIPVVTPVGGLAETVIDSDTDPRSGTGFVAQNVSVPGLVDVLHRAARGWRNPGRRRAIQRRGMGVDWSWEGPAVHYLSLFALAQRERR